MRITATLSTVALALGLVALPAAALTQEGPWLHVRVTEEGGSDNVNLNLPLGVAESVLQLVPQDAIDLSDVDIDGKKLTITDLRTMWSELRKAGDAELFSAENDEQTVTVTRDGDFLRVRVARGDTLEAVKVDLPVTVVDALLSGDGEQLNLRAAINALRDTVQGDLVQIADGGNNVRVWID